MSATRKPASTVYWLGKNLYLNITNRCSNNCYFCFRRYKDGIQRFNLKLYAEPSTKQVIAELRKVVPKRRWNEIVFCGFGEPLVRLDTVLDVTEHIKQNYRTAVRINTNGQGQIITKDVDVVKELYRTSVDRISVSLNAHDHQTYESVCKPKFDAAFQQVLHFTEKAANLFDTEITTVTIPEVDIAKIRRIAISSGANFRIRHYEPCLW